MNPSRRFGSLLFGVVVGALALVMVARDSGAPNPRLGGLAQREWEVREWKIERSTAKGEKIKPLAFRSGGGVISLLQANPLATWQILFAVPGFPGGGTMNAFDRDGGGRYPGLGVPSDIVGVTSEGVSLYLDRTTGQVTSETVSGAQERIVRLDSTLEIMSGCMLDTETIAFVGERNPGQVFIQGISPVASPRRLTTPTGPPANSRARWSTFRFGRGDGGSCVLWSPELASVMIVSDSSVRALALLAEPRSVRWIASLRRALRIGGAPTYARDVTSFPGGVSILYGGRRAGAGRMIDLYSDAGSYIQTMVLPRTAMRVAANQQRIVVLSQREDSVLLASYFLPPSIRIRIQNAPHADVDAHLDSSWVRAMRAGTPRVRSATMARTPSVGRPH